MTRKMLAEQLLSRLTKGPSFAFHVFGVRGMEGKLTRDERQAIQDDATLQVRGWLDTWIVPDVKKLVPELKNRNLS